MSENVFYIRDSRIKYTFCDGHYNDLTKRGVQAKNFFDNLCREIFKKNLEIHERTDLTFPIAYSERSAYSSIGASLHDMKCAHMSEWGIKARYLIDEGDSEKYRRVDFWVMQEIDKEKRVFWLEFKFLCFNIRGQKVFLKKEPRILKAIDQIKQISTEGSKIALCTTVLCLNDSKNMDIEKLSEKKDQIIKSFLEIEDIQKERIVYCVLDFSECYKEYKFYHNNDRIPYIVIFGVIQP